MEIHEDDVDHQLGGFQHFVVPEPEHMVSACPEIFRACVPLFHVDLVLSAVELHDQAMRDAGEVGDEGADRMLAAAFVPEVCSTT